MPYDWRFRCPNYSKLLSRIVSVSQIHAGFNLRLRHHGTSRDRLGFKYAGRRFTIPRFQKRTSRVLCRAGLRLLDK